MQCPTCGYDNLPEMKYCGMCGASLGQTCLHCGQTSPRGYRFCGHCGTAFTSASPLADTPSLVPESPEATPPTSLAPTALSGERRQATVLIADVKGSTVILEQIGSEAWVEVMNQVLQIMGAAIYRFGGQVDQFRGDGLVAFFGARSAHEDDPERAVLAALVMQDDLQQHAVQLTERYQIDLTVRIGINTGEVITASIGNRAQHREDTTMGGAVSLAARLEAAAEPGTVLVSQFTYRLVEARFKWQALGEMPVRGLTHPVGVYRPLRPIFEADQQNRLQAHGVWAPLIGREVQFETLDRAIASLRNGLGGIILLSGEAGMGKSRLMFEVRQHVERDEALLGEKQNALIWLQGRCRSYGQTLPDFMWVDLWHRWLGWGHWVSPEEAVERLRDMVRTLAGERFEEIYPYLAAFLSLPLEEPYASLLRHLDAEGLRHQYFVTMRNWLEILSRQHPVVVVLTEVHWADQDALDLLRFCLPLCNQERILFVVVFRPERTMPVWHFKHFVETDYFHRLKTLELTPLTEAQSETLIQRMIGAGLSAQTRAQILEKSNGNPYYLTELLQSLIERGLLRRDETGQWHTANDEIALYLPDSLKSLLLARIDYLSPDEKRVLQLAAVIGAIFWLNILEYLVKDGHDLMAQLAAMQRAQLITERGFLPDLGREYAFNSALIREAAYESILSSLRGELHLSVANYLEKAIQEKALIPYHGIVAYHYRQAGNWQKDLFHTLLAAQVAQRVHANQEAIQAYTHALTLMGRVDEEIRATPNAMTNEWKLEALQGLGQTHFGIGNVQEAEKHLRAAIALGRQTGFPAQQLTRLFYWLGEVLIWQNRFDEPIHLGEEGLALLGGNNESIEAALMNQLVAVGSSQLGDHDRFIDFTLRTAGFIQRLPYAEELRPAFAHIITLYAYTLKNVPEARRWLEVLRQKAEASHDLRALGEYLEYSGGVSYQQGNLKEATALHEQAIEQFTQIGDVKHASRAWKSLGISLLQQGKLEPALACFERGLETAAVFANDADYAIGYWYRGQVLLCLGDFEKALVSFEKAKKMGKEVPYLNIEWALSGIGRAYLAQGMKTEAQKTFQAALNSAPFTLVQNPYQANEILSGLEQSYDEPEDFLAFVNQFRTQHPEIHRSTFKQWGLHPEDLSSQPLSPLHHEVFAHPLAEGWLWTDPFSDCTFQVQKGLILQAANERNLHHVNRSAPRLLRQTPLSGDFTLQAICQPAAKNKPAIGGLLVWLSDKYWFSLEKGGRGADDLILRGFMNYTDLVFGRGQLKANRVFLRLERRGQWLSAFASAEGKNWLYVGGCELSTVEPLSLGVHAIGHINRLVYPGAYPEGTAIRFDEFWLWENG
ncbi:MAG TPA: adenylate/guanylate cyclase domain-containing protein [Anaerolineales bacterium]|nr:adenylate/guanylate cyclase domain-containing protein [Anaerolineales bacterium]